MANKFPLILNTSANQIQELASGDNLDLTGSGIHNAGIITATSFVGSGSNLTGIDATSIKDSGGNIKIQAQASGAVHTGIHTFNSGAEVGNNIKLGSAGIITATTFKGDGDFVELDVDGHTNLDNVNIAGVATFASAIDLNADLDVDGHTELDNVNVAGIATFGGNRIDIATWVSHIGDPDTRFGFYGPNELTFETGGSERLRINSSGLTVPSGNVTAVDGTFTGNVSVGGTLTYEDVTNVDAVGLITARGGINIQGSSTFTGNVLDFAEGKQLRFGTGNDFAILHSTNTLLENDTAGGNLTINNKSTSGKIYLNVSDGDNAVVATPDGSVEIHYANAKKIETTNIGAVVTGLCTATTGIHIPDDQTIKIGNTSASPDLTIQHISSNSSNRIHATTGYIQYRAVSHFINDENNSVNFIRCEESSSNKVVKLACNGNTKLETKTDGVQITGNINANGSMSIKTSDVDFIVSDPTDSTTNFIWRDYSASTLYLGVSGSADIKTRSDVTPYQNNTYSLGTTALRWANAYVNDMHFSNEGSSNSVDGTWGDWTLQEGDENIFMLNNRTGKKYKMNLTEVS